MAGYYEDQPETSRIHTRPLTLADAPAWASFFADKEATEYFPPSDLSNEERALQWVDWQLNRYNSHRYGLKALIEKSTGNFIGQCGLLRQEVDGAEELEVGYHIFKRYWGQGFAPEAARLFIDYAFGHQLSSSVISIIHIHNARSIRVAEKNGLVREKQTQWSGRGVFVYRTEHTGR